MSPIKTNFQEINHIISDKTLTNKTVIWNKNRVVPFSKGAGGKIQAFFYSLKHQNALTGTQAKEEYKKSKANELEQCLNSLKETDLTKLEGMEALKFKRGLEQLLTADKSSKLQSILGATKAKDFTTKIKQLKSEFQNFEKTALEAEFKQVKSIQALCKEINNLSKKPPEELAQHIDSLAKKFSHHYLLKQEKIDINNLVKFAVKNLEVSLQAHIRGIFDSKTPYGQKIDKIDTFIEQLEEIKIKLTDPKNKKWLNNLNLLNVDHFIKELKDKKELLIFDEFLRHISTEVDFKGIKSLNDFSIQLSKLVSNNQDKVQGAIQWFTEQNLIDNSLKGLIARKINAKFIEAAIAQNPKLSAVNCSTLQAFSNKIDHAVEIHAELSKNSEETDSLFKDSVDETYNALKDKLQEVKLNAAKIAFSYAMPEFDSDINLEEIPQELQKVSTLLEEYKDQSPAFWMAIRDDYLKPMLTTIVQRLTESNEDTTTRFEAIHSTLDMLEKMPQLEPMREDWSALTSLISEEKAKIDIPQRIDHLEIELGNSGLRDIQECISQIKDESMETMYLNTLSKKISDIVKKTYQIYKPDPKLIENQLLLVKALSEGINKFKTEKLDTAKADLEFLSNNLLSALELTRGLSEQDNVKLSLSLFRNKNVFSHFPRLGEQIKKELGERGNLIEDPKTLNAEFTKNQRSLAAARESLKAVKTSLDIELKLHGDTEKRLKPFKDEYETIFQFILNSPRSLPFLNKIDWKLADSNMEEFVDQLTKDPSFINEIDKEIASIEKELNNQSSLTYTRLTTNQKKLQAAYNIKASDSNKETFLNDQLSEAKKELKEMEQNIPQQMLNTIGTSSELGNLKTKIGLLEKCLKEVRTHQQAKDAEIESLRNSLDQLKHLKSGLKKAIGSKFERTSLKESGQKLERVQKKYEGAKAALDNEEQRKEYLLAQNHMIKKLNLGNDVRQ
jgi:hypothetical protein